ncbi:hypothetical protein GMES_2923 [Paraglaciecola mesophila KMM 241]|uniref:Uncharacterized protein n=1 Tax=Paraglaciecola mesophila KMM 241 TaxID=1128912 RepID=K6Z895_9ALTE|nr:hypothetical protein GMES_2923 [Paraglaciecola mesophila KMM 241]
MIMFLSLLNQIDLSTLAKNASATYRIRASICNKTPVNYSELVQRCGDNS